MIAVTYNLKRPAGGSLPIDFYSECDAPATIDAIAGALRAAGHAVALVEANDELPRWFLSH